MSNVTRRDDRRALSDRLPAPGAEDSLIAGSSTHSVLFGWLLAVLAGAMWLIGHLFNEFSFPFVLAFVSSSVLLGLINPAIAAGLTLVIVPFSGGDVSQGLAEFARSAPMLAAAVRIIIDRIRGSSATVTSQKPSRVLFVAAVAAMILYPSIRFTADGAPWAPSETIVDDIFFLMGAPAAMFATWIVVSHIRQETVERLVQLVPVALVVAMLSALAAWIGVLAIEQFTFDGKVYGRLAGLGFPTPTAMGVAIALPLAAAGALRISRSLAFSVVLLGLVTIVLTESRGPLIAVIVAGAAMLVMNSRVSIRVYVGAIVLVLVAVAGLAWLRYPELFQAGTVGRLPDLEGDLLRVVSWVAGIQIALQQPLTGGGWMSVRGWNDGELGDKNVNLSHNLVLQGLADGGVPLGASVAVVVLGALRSAWSLRSYLPPAWIASFVALLVCGAWDMPQLRAFASVMGGMALGLVCRVEHRPAREP